MAKLFMVDFKEKKLLSSRDLSADVPHPDQTCIEKFMHFSQLVSAAMTSIAINTSYEGVLLPDNLKASPIAILNFSKKFKIQDFAYDEDGVRATLDFSGTSFFVNVPWRSVWSIAHAATGNLKKDWPQDFPVMQQSEAEVTE